MTAHPLSKSRLMSARQCVKRLWLDVYRPELAVLTADAALAIRAGLQVGEAARLVYAARFDGNANRVPAGSGLPTALDQTARLLAGHTGAPIFEAAMRYEEVAIRADILVPGDGWGLVEVKAGTEVQEKHRFDCAIQGWVAHGAGVALRTICLAHVDRTFRYAGEADYSGLFAEVDLTTEVRALRPQVQAHVEAARDVLGGAVPQIAVGKHCFRPQKCPYVGHCWPGESEFPILDLGGNKAKLGQLVAAGYRDLRDVPPELLTERQQRIRQVTRSGRPARSADGAAEILALGFPRYYLDFETIAPPVPVWPGAHPYEPLPFQWSCHYEARPGAVGHADFLDLTGQPPMQRIAASLVRVLGREGAVLTYTNYERDVIRRLARHVPALGPALAAIIGRLVDLRVIVERHYYHPRMRGSWSLKAVLPTIAPDMQYSELDGIQDGAMASEGYFEAVDPATPAARKAQLEGQLRRYCHFDTAAMVRLVHFLEGRD